jgi:hypothetical protein
MHSSMRLQGLDRNCTAAHTTARLVLEPGPIGDALASPCWFSLFTAMTGIFTLPTRCPRVPGAMDSSMLRRSRPGYLSYRPRGTCASTACSLGTDARRQLRRTRGERKASASRLRFPSPLARPMRRRHEPRPAWADRVEAPTSVRPGSGGAGRLWGWLSLARVRRPASVRST